MKTVSTILSTGDRVTYEGKPAQVGYYRKGKIQLRISLSATSGVTQELSTRQINQLIKSGKISNP